MEDCHAHQASRDHLGLPVPDWAYPAPAGKATGLGGTGHASGIVTGDLVLCLYMSHNLVPDPPIRKLGGVFVCLKYVTIACIIIN